MVRVFFLANVAAGIGIGALALGLGNVAF